jgi:protein phosphatase methylesterase 1
VFIPSFDRELALTFRQGKFQLEVLPDVGHYLHEVSSHAIKHMKGLADALQDDPSSLASTLVTFWRRNSQVLILPPKIGSTGPSASVEVKRVGEA